MTIAVKSRSYTPNLHIADMMYTNIDEILKDEALAICRAKLYILPDGHKFDLSSRKLIVDDLVEREVATANA